MDGGKVVIASGANSKYFPYLSYLIQTLETGGVLPGFSLFVFDLGLTESETTWLAEKNATVHRPDWPFDFPGRDSQPEWYKAMICRPFLPTFLPDADFIFWLDADCYLQDAAAIHLLLEGARQDGFAAVPVLDRSYSQRFDEDGWVTDWMKKCYETALGPKVAEALHGYPVIAAGLFCGATEAPHWRDWQTTLHSVCQRNAFFFAEQTALNAVIHTARHKTHFLPSYCHWICNRAVPMLDVERQRFVEPQLPHQTIGVVALSAHTKSHPLAVQTTDGRVVKMMITAPTNAAMTTEINLDQKGDKARLELDGWFTERYLDKIFCDIEAAGKVSFLQVGAMDGKTDDQLYDYVAKFDWRGVVCEPLADLFARLTATYGDAPDVTLENSAITEVSGDGSMYRVPLERIRDDSLPPWVAGISSFFDDRNQLAGINVDDALHARFKPFISRESVSCLSVNDLIEKHKIESIDILAIDACGYDFKILKQLDFARFKPSAILLKYIFLAFDEKQECLGLLRKHGYRCYLSSDRGYDLLATLDESIAST